jgi:hypothetical protein
MTVASSDAERIVDDILSNNSEILDISTMDMRGNTPASILKRVLKKRIEYNQSGSSY